MISLSQSFSSKVISVDSIIITNVQDSSFIPVNEFQLALSSFADIFRADIQRIAEKLMLNAYCCVSGQEYLFKNIYNVYGQNLPPRDRFPELIKSAQLEYDRYCAEEVEPKMNQLLENFDLSDSDEKQELSTAGGLFNQFLGGLNHFRRSHRNVHTNSRSTTSFSEVETPPNSPRPN